MNALHITNGDSAGDTLKACGIGGDVLPWRDPMHHGPFPPDLDLDAVSAVRARYLEGPPTDGTAPHVFQRRNELLRAACEYDEVILWFEHDLHDQVQILQLLDWFSTASMGSTKLTIICIDRFEGIDPFRGLGQLNPAQTASLLASRQSVTGAQMTLARQGWAAFRSPDPTILHAFLGGDLTPLPFLAAALARHLEEFPWWKDGLSRSERQILTLAADGIAAPGRLSSPTWRGRHACSRATCAAISTSPSCAARRRRCCTASLTARSACHQTGHCRAANFLDRG